MDDVNNKANVPSGRRRLASPKLQAWLFVLLASLSVFGITLWRLQHAYVLQLRAGEVTTSNLARSMADQARSVVRRAETIVSGIVERLETDGASEDALLRLHHVLANFVAASPSIHDLIAFSANGDGLATSLEPMPKINVADRDYFLFHRNNPGARTWLGPPLRNRADGTWSFTVSQRINRPDGSFGGVVVALMDCEAFSAVYRQFDVGPNGTIWMIDGDATLLARQPPIPGLIGQSFAQAPFVQEYREHGPVGTGRKVSSVDHTARLTSYRKVDDYPLVVFVSSSESDLLKDWYNDAVTALVAAAAISAMLGILGWWLVAQVALRHQQDRAVTQSEAQYRMLADYSSDVIMQFGLDGRRRYVSPAAERVLGYHPLELIDGRPVETIHPEDWPRVAATMETIVTDGQAAPLTYRVRRKDGTYIWVETQGRKLDGDQGYVVALRDISARKQVEDRLHDASNHLQRMAMVDRLTGIANRQSFEVALKKEFHQAARAELPLGLLLLRIDDFENFTNIYGQQAADACLRSVALAIGKQVHRASDFVARYDDREFVVLLPNVDSQDGVVIAERVHAAIAELDIPHAASPKSRVTLTAGFTVGWPHALGTENTVLADALTALARASRRDNDYIHAGESTG